MKIQCAELNDNDEVVLRDTSWDELKVDTVGICKVYEDGVIDLLRQNIKVVYINDKPHTFNTIDPKKNTIQWAFLIKDGEYLVLEDVSDYVLEKYKTVVLELIPKEDEEDFLTSDDMTVRANGRFFHAYFLNDIDDIGDCLFGDDEDENE